MRFHFLHPRDAFCDPLTKYLKPVHEKSQGGDKMGNLRRPNATNDTTGIARANLERFAADAAISGITIVCGENVCCVDPELEFDAAGKVKKSPEMDRRIETYRRFHEGYGEVLVQANVEDTRLGVPEYIASKHNLERIELKKWGYGAKSTGGEIKVKAIERAIELKRRGYIVLPDPEDAAVREAYERGGTGQESCR